MDPLRSETLFRHQAIAALSRRPYGRPIAVMPRAWLWLTVFVLAALIVSSVVLLTVEYAKKETVRGWLVSRHGVARITANVPGTVEAIPIAAGDTVQSGDVLIALSTERYLPDGRPVGDEIRHHLFSQLASIDRQIELVGAAAEIERESLTSQLRDLKNQHRAQSRQSLQQRQRLDAATDMLSRLKHSADSGAVTDWEVAGQADNRALLEQRWAELQHGEIVLERERKSLQARSTSLPFETDREIANLLSEQSRLQQAIASLESGRRVVLTSPFAGTLASIEVHPGSMVVPNQLLVTVLPENLVLAAEVYVPSRAIASIRPGQRVRLTYDGFPIQDFGVFAGEVEQVSRVVLLPSDVPKAFAIHEPTFKVRISISNETATLDSNRTKLRPGMLLAAEIILENRRLIDWLLESLRIRRQVRA